MGNQHFVAKIEVAPAFDPDDLTDADLDVDHLEMIADMIAATNSTGDDEYDELAPRQFQFELCPTCSRQYIQSPLGAIRSSMRLKRYSEN